MRILSKGGLGDIFMDFYRKMFVVTCFICLCSIIGGIIPDIDHIPWVVFEKNQYAGRPCHDIILGVGIILFGFSISCISGLVLFRILRSGK